MSAAEPERAPSARAVPAAPSSPARLGRAARLAGGFALLGVGAALLVLPGPGIPVVLGGLALLAPDVPWAHRLRERLHDRVRAVRDAIARGGGRA